MARKLADYSKPLENSGHEQFSQEYTVNNNATDSYRTAYPKASTETAKVNGCKLLTNTNVACRIIYLQAKLADKTGVSAKMVIQGFMKIAFGALGKQLTNKHKLRALENLAKHLGFYERDNRQQAMTLVEFLKGLKDD